MSKQWTQTLTYKLGCTIKLVLNISLPFLSSLPFFFSLSLFLFVFYFLKKKNVLQGQREADKIWSKEGFYAVVIFLSIFVILVTCLMVSFAFLPLLFFLLFFASCFPQCERQSHILYMRRVSSELLKTKLSSCREAKV